MPDRPAPARGLVVGLDPGERTGLAIFDPAARAEAGSLVAIETLRPMHVLRRIYSLAHAGHDGRPVALVCIEDARALPIYARHGAAGRGERDRIARSVGRVDGLTSLYAEHVADVGLAVRLVEPVRAPKWDADELARRTGYTARTSEHGRDAARLVWLALRAPATFAVLPVRRRTAC
ncbi:MAG TPA: hypothetical protein VGB53_05720 [Rubricoccaceae bacterium]|jgi:hypothetical protein